MCSKYGKYFFAAAAVLVLLTGCGENDVDVDNSDAQEEAAVISEGNLADVAENVEAAKAETFVPKVYMSGEIYGYTVELRDGENGENVELVLSDGADEYAVDFGEDSISQPEEAEFTLRECDDIMNYPSFSLEVFSYGYWSEVYYYGISDGEPVLLGDGWGMGTEGGSIVDLDGDGMNELVCNVMYNADGVRHTEVYYRSGMEVMECSADDMLDEEYDNLGVGSEYSMYLPDEGKVEIFYWLDSIQTLKSKKYDIDLEKLSSNAYVYNELPPSNTDRYTDILVQEYSADLTKDGRDDSIKMYLYGMKNDDLDNMEKLVENNNRSVIIQVYDGDNELYEQEFALTHVANGQLSLVNKDGEYYLLWSDLWQGQGEAAYTYEVFDFAGGEKHIVDSYDISFAVDEMGIARAKERGDKAVLREDVAPDFKSHIEKWFDGSLLLASCDIYNSWDDDSESVYISYGEKQYSPEDYYDTVWNRKDEY